MKPGYVPCPLQAPQRERAYRVGMDDRMLQEWSEELT